MNSTNEFVFGNLLVQYRKRADLTQEELARELKVSRNTISNWETGRGRPQHREDILALEDILRLSREEVNQLLAAADFPIQYDTGQLHQALSPELDTLHVTRLTAETLEVKGAAPPESVPTRIPPPRAETLVGRGDELTWLRQRLAGAGVAALAGVRGVGGIGKTELAIAITRELEELFEGGVIWLDCGPNDIRAVQDRLAAALGIPLAHDNLRTRADALTLALEQRPPTLIVLDDVRRRHLADFDAVQPPSPPCALLVTTRRDDVPLPPAAVKRLDVLPAPQAVQLLNLLLESQSTPSQPELAAQIASFLEGIPLALVLAARRAGRIAQRRDGGDRHPLAVLLQELQSRRRIRAIELGARADLSLVITFDASYDDLDEADRRRMRLLGLFAGNEFAPGAARAAWGDDESEARQALVRLANAGLIEEIEDAVWWIHDLLREYAAEMQGKADPEESAAARLRQAAYWKQYLENISLLRVEDWQHLNSQRPEIERVADEWLLTDWRRDPLLAAELAVEISQSLEWYTSTHWEAWLMAGIEAAEACGQRNATRRLQRSLGEYYQVRGEMEQAERLLRVSSATADEMLQAATTDEEKEGGLRGIAVTQSSLADLLRTRGQYDEAERLYRESLAVFEKLGDSRSVAVTQSSLADLLSTRGQYDEAERLYQSGLEICRKIRDPQGIAVYQMGLGQLALARGQREAALGLLQEARRGFVALGLQHWAAQVDKLLAMAEAKTLALDDLVHLVRAARDGDSEAGQRAWDFCDDLIRSRDAGAVLLGKGLQRFMTGEEPETALSDLSAELRDRIIQLLQ